MKSIIPRTDIVDKEFIEQLIYLNLYRECDEEYTGLLIKIKDCNFWDIALVGDSEDFIAYKAILKTSTNLRLQGKSLSVIREEIYSSKQLSTYADKAKVRCVSETDVDIIEVVKKKVQQFHLYRFFIELNRTYFPKFRENMTILNADVFDGLMKEVENLYENITFDTYNTEVVYTDPDNIDSRISEIKNIYYNTSIRSKIVKTGIDLLDSCFRYNGLESGNLFMIGGSYGIGKTRLITRIGTNAMLNEKVVYHITIENKTQDVMSLYDSAILEYVPEERFHELKNIKNNMDDDVELTKISNEIKDKLCNSVKAYLEVKKFYPYKVTASLIENYLKRKLSVSSPYPDLIIIDHIDIMVPNDESTSDIFRRGELVTGELLELAEKYNTCILFPTQINREGVKNNNANKSNNLGGENVSRSMAKNEMSSLVCTINQSQKEAMNNYARIYIDKNRFGIDKVSIPVKFQKGTLKLETIKDPERLNEFPEITRKSVELIQKRMLGKTGLEDIKQGLYSSNNKPKYDNDTYDKNNTYNNDIDGQVDSDHIPF